MAPQNLNQVFVANDISNTTTGTLITGSTFAVNAAANASKVGVWNLGGTPGYLSTSMMAATGPFQIVQTMPSGNPIASPIIDLKDIKRIKYDIYTASARHTININTLASPSSSKAVMFRIALRNTPTAYANYYQNGTALDLSGGGYEFPLLGNFAAGRMIFNIEVAASEHGGVESALTAAFVSKLVANKTLNALFTVVDNTTSIDILARHAGVVFDIACQYSDGSGAAATAVTTTTGAAGGSGNYWQALSDEKSQRARYGNFNRMYFPTAFPEFAQSGNTYEVVEIQYVHNWPSSTGIARAGELNTIKIYNKVAIAANTKADLVFLGSDASTWGSSATELVF